MNVSEFTSQLLLDKGEKREQSNKNIFYFTVLSKLQNVSGFLFRKWGWHAETH